MCVADDKDKEDDIIIKEAEETLLCIIISLFNEKNLEAASGQDYCSAVGSTCAQLCIAMHTQQLLSSTSTRVLVNRVPARGYGAVKSSEE